jgi:large subunit ribosomal protein L18
MSSTSWKKTVMQRTRRKERIKHKICGSSERPRLSVKRSLNHIYAQLIDDSIMKTLVAVSTLSKELKEKLKKTSNINAAKSVGELLANKAKNLNIDKIVFDRGINKYHGRIKALADAARAGGLNF